MWEILSIFRINIKPLFVIRKNGRGVMKNAKESCLYYKIAAEKGNIDAMNNNGNMLKNGICTF